MIKSDPRIELVEQLLCDVKSENGNLDPTITEIDTAIYHEQDFFDREKEAIFTDAPFILGHESMIENSGDHFCHDHLGRPIIITRAKDGKVRAFLNACRHRGVRLSNGDGVSRRPTLVCPYHNWAYGMDGQLISVPMEESFENLDKSCRSLKQLPCEVRHGFIWVNPNPNGNMDLSSFLGELERDFEHFEVGSQVFFDQSIKTKKTNWKLIVDAFLDGYHVKRLHKKTVGPLFLDCVSASNTSEDHIRSTVARNEFSELMDLDKDQWDMRHHVTFAYQVFPNTTLIFHPDYMSILSVYPVSPDETIVNHICLIPNKPQTDAERKHYERAFSIIENGVFEAEDFFVCEQAQIGMKSGANDTFLIGGYEKSMEYFHAILNRRIEERSGRTAQPT